MTTINLTSTTGSGFLEADFDQLKILIDGEDDGDLAANTAHRALTSGNPHSVSASDVGSTTAQWNANLLQGRTLADTAPTDGQAVAWDASSTSWKPQTISGGGAGTPGGSDTEIQYNNAGAFDGITNVTTDGTDILIDGKQINIVSTAPSAPSTGDIWIDIS